MRHYHGYKWGCSDIYVVCVGRPTRGDGSAAQVWTIWTTSTVWTTWTRCLIPESNHTLRARGGSRRMVQFRPDQPARWLNVSSLSSSHHRSIEPVPEIRFVGPFWNLNHSHNSEPLEPFIGTVIAEKRWETVLNNKTRVYANYEIEYKSFPKIWLISIID